MTEEIWKDVADYEGIYQVSNFGNVKRLARIVSPFGLHEYARLPEKIVKQHFSPRGYMIVRLTLPNTNCKTKMIHRLVAENFIKNPLHKLEVNHLDGNKFNNILSNLEWCTSGENQKHAWATGLRKRFAVGKHPKSRRVKDVINGTVFNSLQELAGSIGMNYSTLKSKLNNGRYKNYIKI